MKLCVLKAALILLLLTPGVPVLQARPASGLVGLEDFITASMKEWKVPGLAIAVVRDGKVVLARGFGYRDLEKQLPVTSETLFAIGSNTKSFTAMILGILNDEGKLDWDRPVREYLPDFRLFDSVAAVQMTSRDLVIHRSGLPRHDLIWLQTGLTRSDLYSRLQHLQPSRAFRSSYQYQNLMFMTAGYLQEKITGRKWEDIVRARILEPIGMKRSNFSVNDSQKDSNFAYPYAEIKDRVQRVPFRNIDEIGPAGSINSSVDEMIRYVQLHLDHGKAGEKQILSEKNSRLMQTPQMVIPAGEEVEEIGPGGYGLGLMISTYRGHRMVQHGGGIDGFISQMAWLPNDRIGVVVLTNFSGNNPLPNLLVRHVFDRLLGMEPIDWTARTRELQAKAEKTREESRKKAAAERRSGTSPSHPLKEYVGRYEHPAYGIAEISEDGAGLKASVVGFTLPLEHFHFDVFSVPENLEGPLGQFGGRRLIFYYNKKGEIDRIGIPLEPAVDDILFVRKP